MYLQTLHKRLQKALLKAVHGALLEAPHEALLEALLKALHEETRSAIEDVAGIHSEPSLPLHPITSSISSIQHLI